MRILRSLPPMMIASASPLEAEAAARVSSPSLAPLVIRRAGADSASDADAGADAGGSAAHFAVLGSPLPDSPSALSSPGGSGRTLFRIRVNLSDGRSGVLRVIDGVSAAELARGFAAEHATPAGEEVARAALVESELRRRVSRGAAGLRRATSAGAIAMPSAPVMALALVAPPIKLAGSPEVIV
jgi:hypothetical protein